MEQEYCLVTSQIEAAWSQKSRNILLGEWHNFGSECKLAYGGTATTPDLPKLSVAEKDKQFEEVKSLSAKLITELTTALNEIHSVNYDRRYWSILIGPFVWFYVSSLKFRYQNLSRVLDRYPVSHTIVVSAVDTFDLSGRDTFSFIKSTVDPHWEHAFYAKIISLQNRVDVVRVSGKLKSNQTTPKDGSNSTLARKMVSKFLSFFSKTNDAFIVSTHLPKFQEALLQISLGQVPQKIIVPDQGEWSYSHLKREKLKKMFSGGVGFFEQLTRGLVADTLPRCFLEGYSDLSKRVLTLPWPDKPRFIYTTSAFDTDEVTKFWIAHKTSLGATYIVGQHGAGYGTSRYIKTKDAIEVSSSNHFISWGTIRVSSNSTPGFIFKIAGLPRSVSQPNGKFLMMSDATPFRVRHWDVSGDYFKNQLLQCDFIRKLPMKIKNCTILRPHQEMPKNDVFLKAQENLGVILGNPHSKLESEIQRSRLVLYFYDSTGIIELMARDIPVIGVWQEGFDHISEQAKKDYKMLLDVGIVFFNHELAARWVTKNWDNIDTWWSSKEVRLAKAHFLDRHGLTTNSPMKTLRKILLNCG